MLEWATVTYAGARATFIITVMPAVKLTACLLTSFDQ